MSDAVPKKAHRFAILELLRPDTAAQQKNKHENNRRHSFRLGLQSSNRGIGFEPVNRMN